MPDNGARGLYPYGSALPRTVRYHSKTGLHTPTVGADGTSTPKGRFVLRADAIRPYSPMGKLLPFNEPLCCGGFGSTYASTPAEAYAKTYPLAFARGYCCSL